MVLESYALHFLESYLGTYVSGVQKENLKFSFMQGNAILENLEVKREALDDFNLPITVKGGICEQYRVSRDFTVTNWGCNLCSLPNILNAVLNSISNNNMVK